MTVLKDQFLKEKEQNPDTPKDEEFLETGGGQEVHGEFHGAGSDLQSSPQSTPQHGWGFYRIISWQNTEFHDAQSTTNPPGLPLVAPGMKNQLSHRGTNPNLKEKTCWDEAVPSTNPTPKLGLHKIKSQSPQPQIWGPQIQIWGIINPVPGVHKPKPEGSQIQTLGSKPPNLGFHQPKPGVPQTQIGISQPQIWRIKTPHLRVHKSKPWDPQPQTWGFISPDLEVHNPKLGGSQTQIWGQQTQI